MTPSSTAGLFYLGLGERGGMELGWKVFVEGEREDTCRDLSALPSMQVRVEGGKVAKN